MYESLLFLAWGITAVHLVVTEREGFSKSAVPGALSAPTALAIVAGATLALPAELQRASALVPALKSNWLMMHVSAGQHAFNRMSHHSTAFSAQPKPPSSHL